MNYNRLNSEESNASHSTHTSIAEDIITTVDYTGKHVKVVTRRCAVVQPAPKKKWFTFSK